MTHLLQRQSDHTGFILGSFFYGYIFTQIPGGFLATRYGGKRVFLTGICATALLTIATPILTKSGTGYLITTRVLEGLFEVTSSTLIPLFTRNRSNTHLNRLNTI